MYLIVGISKVCRRDDTHPEDAHSLCRSAVPTNNSVILHYILGDSMSRSKKAIF